MAIPQSLDIPYKEKLVDDSGFMTRVAQDFFRFIKNALDPLGIEKTYNLLNNQSTATKITGLRFNKNQVRQVFIDYFIQRVTSTTELVEAGVLRLVYKPDSELWNISYLVPNGPDNAGVVFIVDTSTGEIQYTSTNVSGTQETFKLSIRARTMFGGNLQ